MQLDLTREDAAVLHDLLQTYLPEIRREAAATDPADLRRQLAQRQQLCERLIHQLTPTESNLEPAHHQL